jgi:hypothetical protein
MKTKKALEQMIKAITHAEDTSVAIKNADALKAELDKVVNKPAGKERLAALAKLANGLK